MSGWNPENRFDSGRPPDTYLDVGFVPKPGIRIERVALGKYSADSIKFLVACLFAGIVQEIDNRAVQPSEIQVTTTSILWRLCAGSRNDRAERSVGLFDCL